MDKVRARAIVEELIAEFLWAVDHGATEDAATMFSFDCSYGYRDAMVDHAGMVERMAARAAMTFVSRHLVGNVRILDYTPSRIEATATALICRLDRDGSDTKTMVLGGDWHLSVVFNGAWVFRSMMIDPAALPAV